MPQEEESVTMKLTRGDDGQEIELHKGDLVEINLPARPGTGYAWAIDAVDEGVLAPVGEGSFEHHAPMPGGGTTQSWRFRAVSPGTTLLRLAYRRPWEGSQAPEERFEVWVRVR